MANSIIGWLPRDSPAWRSPANKWVRTQRFQAISSRVPFKTPELFISGIFHHTFRPQLTADDWHHWKQNKIVGGTGCSGDSICINSFRKAAEWMLAYKSFRLEKVASYPSDKCIHTYIFTFTLAQVKTMKRWKRKHFQWEMNWRGDAAEELENRDHS